MAACFEKELDVTTVACEFGIPQQDFEKRLAQSTAMARSFGALRTPGGTIKREVFATMFGEAAIEFRLTIDANIRITPGGRSTGTVKLKGSDDSKPSEIRRIEELGWGVKSLAFSPSGGQLAAGKSDDAILMFDVDSKAKLDGTERLDSMGNISACQFSPNGSHLLAGGYRGTIQVYDVTKEGRIKLAGQFAGHSKEITEIAISLDSKRALSGSTEEKVRYWQIDTGRELGAWGGFDGKIKACYISANGKTGMATDGATLLLIDLTKLEVTKKMKLTSSWASGQCAAFSPDGELVAVGDSYAMRVWEIATNKELPKLEDKEIQWSACFTPDGKRLVTGASGVVNVWDVRKTQRLSALPCPSGYIHSVVASPDNKHAAAGTGPISNNISVFRLPDVSK
jgi:WD40 repeat protein